MTRLRNNYRRPSPPLLMLYRLVACALALSCFAALPVRAGAAPEQWQGAAFAGDPAALEKLATAGAKVVRVYGESDAWVLDAAQRLGLRVVMGLSVAYPRDADALRAQEQQIRRFVERHRKHPALLAWGVGNEVETGTADPLPAWREINRLAGIIKTIDPAHPTLMVVVDGGIERLKLLAACCAHIDLLGINAYAGAAYTLPQRVRDAGITKPVVIGELGPLGQWQAGTKPWGAPVEPTSSEKAVFFRDVLAFLRTQPQIAGTFPFLWGAKQEQTETWHGLLLADGSLTAMSDALTLAWGKPVAEPAPAIRGIGIAADAFAPGQEVSAGVDAASFDGSPLRTEWKVLAEATDLRGGSGIETPPARIAVSVLHADAASVRFLAPQQPGAYRLFITIRDHKGKAATANLPFLVR
ncbi:glycoside hydrolase family 2 TIM barrel-domain containing protein [Azoarcus sp. CIB]|uniref:glycoside hydrolase family 2 TIM barrel-domain containing protein n=1 Tax=Aromatoleum sp. (strain CIB) TaxID=198107 RepID=UPI0009F81E5D|nr:glycoside hydrolase family 2 TIM barrel-domain containing protein [Azoarcus sp. CIB]